LATNASNLGEMALLKVFLLGGSDGTAVARKRWSYRRVRSA
jgi:hypothetical protein